MLAARRRKLPTLFFTLVLAASFYGLAGLERAIASEPVAALSFNEGKGDLARDSAGAHDGLLSDGAKWTESGKFGSAVEFDGEQGLVSIPENSGIDLSDEFTVEAWVRPDQLPDWPTVFVKEDDKEAWFTMLLYANSPGDVPRVDLDGGEAKTKSMSGNEELPLSTWTHLALTSDGEQMRLYVDGELEETEAALPLQNNDGALRIGGNEIWGEHFDGRIDEARVYEEVLSAEEIEEDMETAIESVPRPDPIAALSFDEGKGGMARDSVGAHDGTVDGAAWTESGKFGSALEFDGTNDMLRIPNAPELELKDSFTLEAWVNLNELKEWNSVFTKETAEGWFGYQLYAGGNDPEKPMGAVADGIDTNVITANSELSAETWTHLAFASTGKEMRVYVDGQLEGTETALSAQASSGELLIGGNEIFNEFLDGRIDEIRVFDDVLSSAEIEEDMEAEIGLASPGEGSKPDPIAALSFDEGKGNIARDSFGDNDGVVQGAKWVEGGKHGGALDFDTEDDLVSIADANDLDLKGDFTLEAWVKPDTMREWATLFAKRDSKLTTSYQVYAQNASEVTSAYLTGPEETGGHVIASEPLPLSIWSHVAITSDGEQLRLYVNGLLDTVGDAIPLTDSDEELQIGSNEIWESEHLDGLIDEVRIYDEVLDSSQIEDDMETGIGLVPYVKPEPVAALSLDEGEGEVAHDSAGSHDGTLEGPSWTEGGKFGSALEFDGEDDIVTIPDSAELDLEGGFTVEAWAYPTAAHEWSTLLIKDDPNEEVELPFSYLLYAEGEERPTGFIRESSSEYQAVYGKEALPTNTWSHLAMTNNGSTMRLYVDGELQAAAPSPPIEGTEGPLQIGGHEMFGDYFEGRIDELRVYDEVLWSAELQEDMETEIDEPQKPACSNVPKNGKVDKPVGVALTCEGTGKLAYELESEPDFGIISSFDSEAGTLIYTPEEEFTGVDSFDFAASNAVGKSAVATATLHICSGPRVGVGGPAVDEELEGVDLFVNATTGPERCKVEGVREAIADLRVYVDEELVYSEKRDCDAKVTSPCGDGSFTRTIPLRYNLLVGTHDIKAEADTQFAEIVETATHTKTATEDELVADADDSEASSEECAKTKEKVKYREKAQEIIGTKCNDTIIAPNGYTDIYGRAGNDFIRGTGAPNFISGGKNNDVIVGGRGNDEIYGKENKDRLIGGAGDDDLFGEAGENHLIGGAGADELVGGVEDDLFRGGTTSDTIFAGGGTGIDTLSYADGVVPGFDRTWEEGVLTPGFPAKFQERGVWVDLRGEGLSFRGDNGSAGRFGGGTDNLQDVQEFENVIGTPFADVIIGSDSETISNVLSGGPGTDIIRGGKGNDTLYGGEDNDLLDGDEGPDSVIGGAAQIIVLKPQVAPIVSKVKIPHRN